MGDRAGSKSTSDALYWAAAAIASESRAKGPHCFGGDFQPAPSRNEQATAARTISGSNTCRV
jgi:hypothetical protein